MKTLFLLGRVGEVEQSARLNVVYVPDRTVVLPGHAGLELRSQMNFKPYPRTPQKVASSRAFLSPTGQRVADSIPEIDDGLESRALVVSGLCPGGGGCPVIAAVCSIPLGTATITFLPDSAGIFSEIELRLLFRNSAFRAGLHVLKMSGCLK